MTALGDIVSTYLSAQDPLTRARGRVYFDEGRVELYAEEANAVRAYVRGKDTYDTSFYVDETGALGPSCSCPAWRREFTCKHLAALAWALAREHAGAASLRRTNARPKREPLPASLALVSSAHSFFARLALYEGRPIQANIVRWGTLASWWQHPHGTPEPQVRALEALVAKHREDIESVARALRAWRSAPVLASDTPWDALRHRVAQLYEAVRETGEIRTLPGPLDERHPGWTFSFDEKTRTVRIAERPSPLVASSHHLDVQIPIQPGAPLGVPSWLVREGDCDAWALSALRALAIALEEETDDAVRDLAVLLRRPLWESALARVAEAASRKKDEAHDWAFTVAELYSKAFYSVNVYGRKARGTAWKKMSFEVFEDGARTPLEREIARIASMSLESRTRAPMALASAHGHELARLLAQHARIGRHEDKPQFDGAPAVRIVAGDLGLRLEPDATDVVRPIFTVNEAPLSVPISSLATEEEPRFLAGSHVAPDGVLELISARIPEALREWVAVVREMGDFLTFPREALALLARATEPLTQTGLVKVSRAALGRQLGYDPKPALQVEWRDNGKTKVDVLIEMTPRAPLVAPGVGAEAFSFIADDGESVWVERNLEMEKAIVEAFEKTTTSPVRFFMQYAEIEDGPLQLLFARWLQHNPEKLRIELKHGAPPRIARSARSLMTVRERDGWFDVSGELEVEGARVTIGEMLRAVRQAEGFIKVREGVFYELSEALAKKLRPFAYAASFGDGTDDAQPGATKALVSVHRGFGLAVYDAAQSFDEVRAPGIDLEQLARVGQSPPKKAPKRLIEQGELREYQREGALWMMRLAEWAPGCILADDMGLGKTVQTAAVLRARASLGPALIVAPASVTSNWLSELARFVPSLAVRWFNEEKHAALDDLGARDVVVVSYTSLWKHERAFGKTHWATVVVDEAQFVKNVFAKRRNAVHALRRDFTVALTGTPVENHLGELFSIVDLVFPGLLGDTTSFGRRFRRPIEGAANGARLEALARLLEPFLLRRTRASVLSELPPRQDITEWIDLTVEEKRRYMAMRNAFKEELEVAREKKTPARLRIIVLAALLRLRQLACDVRLIDPKFDGPTTKIARCVELATEIRAGGNRALVFSAFTQLLEKAKHALEAAGLRVAWLAGETPTEERRAVVDAFQAGEYDVFCISLQAGGTGLNLTRASYVIHLDPWWNPAVEEQATARSHRMGQTDPVTVYRLIARGTIEEAVLDMQINKRILASAVLEGKGDARVIKPEELIELLQYG